MSHRGSVGLYIMEISWGWECPANVASQIPVGSQVVSLGDSGLIALDTSPSNGGLGNDKKLATIPFINTSPFRIHPAICHSRESTFTYNFSAFLFLLICNIGARDLCPTNQAFRNS